MDHELKILSIEDESILRRTIARILKKKFDPKLIEMRGTVLGLIKDIVGDDIYKKLCDSNIDDVASLENVLNPELSNPDVVFQIAQNISEKIQKIYGVIYTDHNLHKGDDIPAEGSSNFMPKDNEIKSSINNGIMFIELYRLCLDAIQKLSTKLEDERCNGNIDNNQKLLRVKCDSTDNRLKLLQNVAASLPPNFVLTSGKIDLDKIPEKTKSRIGLFFPKPTPMLDMVKSITFAYECLKND
jgi:hypothetical protein